MNALIQYANTPDELSGLLGPRPLAKAGKDGKPLMGEDGYPILATNADGKAQIKTRAGLTVNSLLFRDEWKAVDTAITRRARELFTVDARITAAGLTTNLGGLGVLSTTYYVATEKPLARAVMDTRTGINMDRVEKRPYSIPVPVIISDFMLGERELAASRRMGNDLDTTEAEESTQSVIEKFEDMWFNGDTTINVGGSTIYGFVNTSSRLTDTATNFGGGDFGTVTNIEGTFAGVLNGAVARRLRGPFGVFVASQQYHEMLKTYTDGSGQTALTRVSQLPRISFIEEAPQLTAGQLLFVQLTSNYVDKAIALPLTTREWTTPDGSATYFRIMMAAVPRIKTDSAGYAGVVHVTGA